MNEIKKKIKHLETLIKGYKSVVIAFSGGVDSTFLTYYVHEVLKKKILAITATSSTYPFYELNEAKDIAKKYRFNHRIINSEETKIPGFSDNPTDRCYYCKGELFGKLKKIANSENYDAVFDGSNLDDLKDYRPGVKAKKEHGIISPLCEAGLSKSEIRLLSKQYGLPTADKPAYACLASRFPYGEKITSEKLDRVAKAEFEIRKLGFKLFRVRSHNNVARIEFDENDMEKAWAIRKQIYTICRNNGFIFVSIDLLGYRMGAMNVLLE